jgi:hypothetical protein
VAIGVVVVGIEFDIGREHRNSLGQDSAMVMHGTGKGQ